MRWYIPVKPGRAGDDRRVRIREQVSQPGNARIGFHFAAARDLVQRVEQLFVEGKYMVIYLSPETAVYDELGYYLWNKDGNGELSTSVI